MKILIILREVDHRKKQKVKIDAGEISSSTIGIKKMKIGKHKINNH